MYKRRRRTYRRRPVRSRRRTRMGRKRTTMIRRRPRRSRRSRVMTRRPTRMKVSQIEKQVMSHTFTWYPHEKDPFKQTDHLNEYFGTNLLWLLPRKETTHTDHAPSSDNVKLLSANVLVKARNALSYDMTYRVSVVECLNYDDQNIIGATGLKLKAAFKAQTHNTDNFSFHDFSGDLSGTLLTRQYLKWNTTDYRVLASKMVTLPGTIRGGRVKNTHFFVPINRMLDHDNFGEATYAPNSTTTTVSNVLCDRPICLAFDLMPSPGTVYQKDLVIAHFTTSMVFNYKEE